MASSKPSPIVFGDLHDGAFFAHASQPATRPPHCQRADATASCSVRGVDANVGDDEINEGEQPWRRGIDTATHALCVGSPRVVAPPVAPHTAPPAAQPAKSTLASKVFALKRELDMEPSLPIPAAIAAANHMMGLNSSGSLVAQVAELLRITGIEMDAALDASCGGAAAPIIKS